MQKEDLSPQDLSILDYSINQLDSLIDLLSLRFEEGLIAEQESVEFRRRPLVLFLGSGFSRFLSEGLSNIPAGWQFSWKDLVTGAVSLLDEQERDLYGELACEDDVSEFKLWCLAQILGPRLDKYVCESFVCERSRLELVKTANGRQWASALNLFQKCDGIVTTNFDPLLGAICKDLQSAGTTVLRCSLAPVMNIPPRLMALLEGLSKRPFPRCTDKFLLDIHGTLTAEAVDAQPEPNSLVLTLPHYVSAYAPDLCEMEPGQVSRPRFLQHLLKHCNVVILGYSLKDYFIRTVFIQAASQLTEDAAHYLVVGKPAELNGATQKLSCTYLSPEYLGHMRTMYGLRVIPIEAIVEAHAFREQAESPAVPTLSEGLDRVMMRLTQQASAKDDLNSRSLIRRLLG